MKRLCYALPLILISCTPYVQLFETKTTSLMQIEKDYYTFENDTVRIVYSFWADHGTLGYTVFNKLDVPIYIDWKKSSYVKNSEKLDYWIDVSTTKTIGKINGPIYYGSIYGKSYNNSTTIKPEQIVFIAPKSTITKDQFILFTYSNTKFDNTATRVKVKSTYNPKKDAIIKSYEYNENNSPLSFRNFLTISTSDKFIKEAYIDNGFFLYKKRQRWISETFKDCKHIVEGLTTTNIHIIVLKTFILK